VAVAFRPKSSNVEPGGSPAGGSTLSTVCVVNVEAVG